MLPTQTSFMAVVNGQSETVTSTEVTLTGGAAAAYMVPALNASGELDSSMLPPVFGPWTSPSPWATGASYVVGPPSSLVTQGGNSYVCVVPHVAGVFATDLAAGKWVQVTKGPAAIWVGSGAPGPTVGSDSDYYIDALTDTIYGPKAGGSWPSTGNATGTAVTDKVGGTQTYQATSVGNAAIAGSTLGTGNLWSNKAALPAGRLQSATIYVAAVGNGTGHLVISMPGSPYTILAVLAISGIAATGAKTLTAGVDFPAAIAVPAGAIIGWHASAGGAQISYNVSNAGAWSDAAATVNVGDTFTPTSNPTVTLSLSASVGVMPQVVDARLGALEAAVPLMAAPYRAATTIGSTTGNTNDASGAGIWCLNQALTADSFLTAFAMRFSAAGTGEIHVLAPDAGGGGYTNIGVYPITVAAGVNSFTLGLSGAITTACPTMPPVLFLPAGSIIGYKTLTGVGPRYAVSGSFTAYTALNDTGLGATGISLNAVATIQLAMQLTTVSLVPYALAPSTRDSIVSAKASTSGLTVTVSGLLNRRGVAVPFYLSATLTAPAGGSVAGEAHTIVQQTNVGFALSPASNVLAHADVSSVVVHDASTGTPLVENTDYMVNYEHGGVGYLPAGSRSVTIDYTWSARRYDVLSLNPETMTLVKTSGTDRVRDAAEFIPTISAAPLNSSQSLPLFNCRVAAGAVEAIPIFDVFGGQRRALITEMAEDRRRGRACLRRTLAKLRSGGALTIAGFGDSQTSISDGSVTATIPNGVLRDTASQANGYFQSGQAIGSDLYSTLPLYDFGDGGGAIHTRMGWNWTMIAQLAASYTSAVAYLNFGLAGSSSVSAAVGTAWYNAVLASAANLVVLAFGQNELGNTGTEFYVSGIVAGLVAGGKDVIVMGSPRQNSQFGATDANWFFTQRALRRAAELNGGAFCDLTSLYADENIGALGLSRKDHCQTNLFNHPGIREHGVIGRLLASLLLDE